MFDLAMCRQWQTLRVKQALSSKQLSTVAQILLCTCCPSTDSLPLMTSVNSNQYLKA